MNHVCAPQASEQMRILLEALLHSQNSIIIIILELELLGILPCQDNNHFWLELNQFIEGQF